MKTSHHQLSALIAQTGRQWRQTVDRQLQPFGLTQATWLPLWHLARAAEPLRQKDLAALLQVDGSALVRTLDTLEKQGLILRKSGEDRRAKTLHLTREGQKVADQVGQVANAVREQVLGPLDENDLDTTLRVLERLMASLKALEQESPNEQ
ncbi:MarR family transcriptional regulator [Gallaecimonas kandeliae]|uniref:MarR family winged helix-turn-helix transcriptional regulator n=1 Tax=Gallaecimonas kandeliae TaxID=3029055 RepID=UPI0026477BDA|nr:MarR family transcriptional regulator [Gallaecimonas kandeliae]WKE65228.1 MarR family transcriptional regulator [Gallaecimonas kandeliae]